MNSLNFIILHQGKYFSRLTSLFLFIPQYHSLISDSCKEIEFSHSVMSDSVTPQTAARQAPLPITNSQCSSSQWCHPAISFSVTPSPPIFSLSQHQGLFKLVSSSHQVAKILELQVQHKSFQWILGLISFRMDWLDLLAVQGTLKSLL